jgi:hypothetical protein
MQILSDIALHHQDPEIRVADDVCDVAGDGSGASDCAMSTLAETTTKTFRFHSL